MSHDLVIGYGNPLRGDDGVGWDAALALRAACTDGSLEVLTVRQLTPELAENLSRADRVVFIDARVDAEPGAVAVQEIEPDPSTSTTFTHHCDPQLLLSMAYRVFGHAPDPAWIVTVGAEQFDCEECLSATVRHALPEVIGRVRELVGVPELCTAP